MHAQITRALISEGGMLGGSCDDPAALGCCPVCFHCYDEQPEERLPITLPDCGHSFCRACCGQLWQTAPCPTCRSPITHRMEELKPSYEILALSKQVRRALGAAGRLHGANRERPCIARSTAGLPWLILAA